MDTSIDDELKSVIDKLKLSASTEGIIKTGCIDLDNILRTSGGFKRDEFLMFGGLGHRSHMGAAK